VPRAPADVEVCESREVPDCKRAIDLRAAERWRGRPKRKDEVMAFGQKPTMGWLACPSQTLVRYDSFLDYHLVPQRSEWPLVATPVQALRAAMRP
jgi:hypothetical protein